MKAELNNEEKKLREALKGDSFNVPEGYFEKLQGNVMDQINALPDFEKTSVTNPFSVPENYFETLPLSVGGKLKTQNPKLLGWLLRPRIAISLAFATILLLAGIYFYNQRPASNQPMEECTAEDLRDSNFLQSIDEATFVDVLAELNTDTTYDDYEQYLIDNNIEISQIENAL